MGQFSIKKGVQSMFLIVRATPQVQGHQSESNVTSWEIPKKIEAYSWENHTCQCKRINKQMLDFASCRV